MNIRKAFQAPEPLSAVEWCESNFYVVESASKGKWTRSYAPWTNEFINDIGDPRVSRVGARCSAQSSKTESSLGGLAHSLDQDFDPTMWVAASADDAGVFATGRLMPALEKIQSLAERMPSTRSKKKLKEIYFQDGVFEIVGAAGKTKLQSKPRAKLFLDEVRNWHPDRLPTVLKRNTSFWNKKTVMISTAGKEKDAVDQFFNNGDQRHWHVPCMQCGYDAPLDFHKGIRWDTNETTQPGGAGHPYDFEELSKTIRYECSNCQYAMLDTPDVRRDWICGKGFWKPHNLKAPDDYHTYTWNSLIVWWEPWRNIVEEFLNATWDLKNGNLETMKEFVQEKLGRGWQDRMGHIDGEDILEKRRGGFKMGDPWAPALIKNGGFRALTVDVQRSKIYYVVRDWSSTGQSRLVAYGTEPDLAHLTNVILKHKVLDQRYVFIDSGKFAGRVYKACVNSGRDPNGDYLWKPTKGAGEQQRKTWKDEHGTDQIYVFSWQDPFFGTADANNPRVRKIRLITYNDYEIQELFDIFICGEGPEWWIGSDTDAVYKEHIMSEERVSKIDAYGTVTVKWSMVPGVKDNHWRDAEKTQVLVAKLAGVLKTVRPSAPIPPPLPPQPGRDPEPENEYDPHTLPGDDTDGDEHTYHLRS